MHHCGDAKHNKEQIKQERTVGNTFGFFLRLKLNGVFKDYAYFIFSDYDELNYYFQKYIYFPNQ